MGIILWIIVGLLAGWLANVILGNARGGLLYKLAVAWSAPSSVVFYLSNLALR